MKEIDLEIVFEKLTLEGLVSPENYVLALEERADNMSDEAFGDFIKKTLWTVTGRK